MKIRRTAGLLALAVAGTALLAPTSHAAAPSATTAPPANAAVSRHRVDFEPCPGSTEVQCGRLRVPVDWARPGGATITVAVARRPADDPAHRIGTLFYNPGGPGDGAVDNVVDAETYFSETLRARFDIVGMDPRGVGASSPITCGVPALTPGYTFFPRTRQQYDAMVAHNRAVARSCLRHTGPLVQHADTVSVARDHEALRTALGVRKVSWLGLSYGTQLGAQYARLFPAHTRAMVLDAALDHSSPEVQLTAEAAVAEERSFDRFAAWCDTADACALRGQDVAAVYDRLVSDADQHPLPVEGALRPVTGEDIRMNTPLYLSATTPNALAGELTWPLLSQGIAAAAAGEGAYFAYPPPAGPTDNLFARLANHCGDYVSDVHSFADMQRRIEMGRQLAPHLQGASEFWLGGLCIGYPLEVANPQHRLAVDGVPTLVVHAVHDSSVAYPWAFDLASQIHGSSVLTRLGDGHTSYYSSPCAREASDEFLLTRRSAPAPVCEE